MRTSIRPARVPRVATLALACAGLLAPTRAATAADPKAPPSPSQAQAMAAAAAGGGGEDLAKAIAESWPDRPEWLDMFVDILQGSQLGPNDGWFRRAVAQTRFTWDAARARYDRDGDGKVARREFPGSDTDFARLDRDRSGVLSREDFDFTPHALSASPGAMLYFRADADGNGKVTREELDGFFKQVDRGGQGFLSLSDLQEALPMPSQAPAPAPSSAPKGGGGGGGRGGPSKETLIRGLFRQEIGSLQPGPSLNEKAPDFTLKTNDGARDVTLSKLVGPKPVVLVFGNFTCGPFRSRAGDVEKLFRNYRDRATFVMVYVREAHPTDGWSMDSNDRVGVSLPQPRTYEERVKVAQTCSKRLDLGFPMLVDTIDDAVGARYSGMPSRLYLIDRDGKVAYKSGRGPFGFKPAELEQSLVLLLQENSAPRGERASVPLATDAEAWSFLPPAERGGGQPLPAWARALARSLPRTTAAMLDLDRLHRTRNPLGPVLRGKMRWAAAEANRCDYSRAVAEADLRRAGVSEADLRALRGDWSNLPPTERAAVEFARKMTLQADTVTDDQVAALKAAHGEEKLAAMVLLLAYANFQDRLLLTLGVAVEPGGPMPPVDVRFAKSATAPKVPARVAPDPKAAPAVADRVDDPEWLSVDFDALQKGLEGQKARPGRVRVPSFEEVLSRLPADYPKPKNPVRIRWSLVCMGYQPELAAAWGACTRAFGEESKQDRVFEESLFWVVTRTIHCFY